MNQWAADWANDPDDDYNLVLEILCNDENIAVIKQSHQGLIFKWYPNKDEITVPFKWLLNLFVEAEKRLEP